MSTITKGNIFTTRSIKDLRPSEDNVRRDPITPASVEGLAASIVERGLLAPLVVRPDGEIIAGHRRFAALQLAIADKRLPKDFAIDCIVREGDPEDEHDVDGQIDRLIENLQRSDISPMDEAWGYYRLIEFGQKQVDLAARVGMSKAHVSKRLALLRLHEDVQAKVANGDVKLEKALALASIKDQDLQVRLADQPESTVARAIEEQKREAEKAKFVARLEGLGLEVAEGVAPKPEEGKSWEETSKGGQSVTAEGFDDSVPRYTTLAVVSQKWNGEVYARFYKPVKVERTEADRKESAAEKKARLAREKEAAKAEAVLTAKLEAVKAAASTLKKSDYLAMLIKEERRVAVDQLNRDDALEVCRIVGIPCNVDDGDDAFGILQQRLDDPLLKEADLYKILTAAYCLSASISRHWTDDRAAVILEQVGFDPEKVDA